MDFTQLKQLVDKLYKALEDNNTGVFTEVTNQIVLLVSDMENVALAHGLIEAQSDPNKKNEIVDLIVQNKQRMDVIKKRIPKEKADEVLGVTTEKEPTPPQPKVVSKPEGVN